jgi:small subunit ribosomal protein S2
MALVDTNCDPDPIDYVIACNDDALKSVKLILNCLTEAIIEKKKEMKIAVAKQEKKLPLKGIVEEEKEIDVSDKETEEEV